MFKDDGGPAFPCMIPGWKAPADAACFGEDDEHIPGMSLRDWFAGQAMQLVAVVMDKDDLNLSHHNIALEAYSIADAMLAEGKRKPEGGDA